jgi:hypothetical protein
MEWINSLTPANALTFLLILAALLWLFDLISKAIKNYRELKKPKTDADKTVAAKIADHDKFFAADKQRLDAHDKDIDDLREGMKKNCAGVMALLNHQLHDGNTDEMSKASSELDAWLINR